MDGETLSCHLRRVWQDLLLAAGTLVKGSCGCQKVEGTWGVTAVPQSSSGATLCSRSPCRPGIWGQAPAGLKVLC